MSTDPFLSQMVIKSNQEDNFKFRLKEKKNFLATVENVVTKKIHVKDSIHTSKKADASDKLHLSETCSFVTVKLSGKPAMNVKAIKETSPQKVCAINEE